MLDKQFFLKVAPNVRDRYKEHIFGKGKDVFGRKFKGYSKEYGEAKRGNKFKGQASKYANTTSPILTEATANDFGNVFDIKTQGFTMGWSTYGSRVVSLNKRGRVLSSNSQPMPKEVINYMMSRAKPFTDKKLKRLLPKSKTYKIGKK